MAHPITDQPAPVPNDRPDIWALVLADMAERRRVGIERYGTPLQPGNGRDALVDLYQELLDAVVYARQYIEERAAEPAPVTPPDDLRAELARTRQELADERAARVVWAREAREELACWRALCERTQEELARVRQEHAQAERGGADDHV